MNIARSTPHGDPLVAEASISDLFFNHEHPQYDAALEREGAGDFTRRAALTLDATEFAEALARGTGVVVAPSELVADFLTRL